MEEIQRKNYFKVHLKGFGGSLEGKEDKYQKEFQITHALSLSPSLPEHLDMTRR